MKIHPFTFLYLFLAYWGHSSYYVAFLLFSILHEIGHYCMALFYRFEIESVVILPFGAFLSLEDFGLHAPYQEIIMLIMGPFVNLVLGLVFYILEINELFEINIFIFLFNLLPIYPLDGSKLFLLFLSYFVNYKKCFQIQIKLSLLTLSVLFVYTKQIGRKIVIGYLLYQTIVYLKQYSYIYVKTLLNDHLKKKRIKVNKKMNYYRPYHNLYELNGKLYDFEIIKIYLLKSR